MKELKIQKNESGQRFDKFLKKYLDASPGSFIYKMLRKKNITLNGKKASGNERLEEGDIVRFFLSDETILKFRKNPSECPKKRAGGCELQNKSSGEKDLKLDIIYEDPDIIAVNKPAGLLCQKDFRNEDSLAELLVRRLLSDQQIGPDDLRAFRPAPVNRLDRNTSGIVLCGKSLRGLQFLSKMLHERTVKKEYLAIVFGKMREPLKQTVYFEKNSAENRVSLYDSPAEGRGVMKTEFCPVAYGTDLTLVRVHLITGKTHQIRAHLSYLGYPIVGDPKYGDSRQNAAFRKNYRISRQMLHSFRVTFPELEGDFSYLSGKTIEAGLPPDMERMKDLLQLEKTQNY